MAKTRKSQPPSTSAARGAPQQPPTPFEPRPPKKHPLVLAITAALLVIWLTFLAYLAFRG
jgi:hypothetical protein